MAVADPGHDEHRHGAGRDFVAGCYEVFLGRDAEPVSVIEERGQWPIARVIQSFVESDEFGINVYDRIQQGAPLQGIFSVPLLRWSRYWIVERLPVMQETAQAVLEAKDWRELLSALVMDEGLMALGRRTALQEADLRRIAQTHDMAEAFQFSPMSFDPRQYSPILHDPDAFWI